MDQEQIESFFQSNGGVASVNEVAELLQCDEGAVRGWARKQGIRRIGSTFAFSLETAVLCSMQLGGGSALIEQRDDLNARAMDWLRSCGPEVLRLFQGAGRGHSAAVRRLTDLLRRDVLLHQNFSAAPPVEGALRQSSG